MPPDTTETAIGSIELVSWDSSFSLRCSALAYDQVDGQRPLMVASLAGPHTSVKAFRAALSTGNARFRTNLPGHRTELRRWPNGYQFHAHRLGFQTWQLLAIASRTGLIPKLDDASLWSELRSERFSTPVLRSWLPWLREELEQRQYLTRLPNFQCEAAVLSASSEDLDQILQDRAPLRIAV